MPKQDGDENERARIYRKVYYREHREKLLKYQREYYIKRKENGPQPRKKNYTLEIPKKLPHWRGEKITGGYIKTEGKYILNFM